MLDANIPSTVPSLHFGPEGQVNELRLKSTRIGIVNIQELGKRRYQLRYRDLSTHLEVKRRVSGLTLKEVQAMAAHLSTEAYAGRGYLAARKKCPSVEDGMREAIRLSRRRDHVRRETQRLADKFVQWLADRFSQVKQWADLKPFMVENYIRCLEESGLAFDTVRLHLQPVKMGWRFAADNYPDEVRPMPRVRQSPAPPKQIECLEAGELASLLDWLRGRYPDLHCMACLQGLCGLRTLEAAHLRRCDIDLRHGAVAITDTETHVPKNKGSYRVLPICLEALNALTEYMNGQTVIPSTGALFLTCRGTPWTASSLHHRWAKAPAWDPRREKPTAGGVLFQAAKDLGMPRLAEVQPHRLRSTFATMASRLGASDRLLKAYLGHSPGDILGSHYRAVDLAELRSVSVALSAWRTLGADRETWKLSGNFEETAFVKA
ncbi:MAG: Tyrosine recombinase XerC [bacterium]|nr:Tyrosine recombinase XerC [bacterium]